jgi:hypothetical protein
VAERHAFPFLARGAHGVALELDDNERTVLVELLIEAVQGTAYALAPRPRQFMSILHKLDVGSTVEAISLHPNLPGRLS